MKILIRNKDNVVIYADDSVVLSSSMASGNGWVDHNFNSTNATIADATIPSHWSGGIWSYVNSIWAVSNTVGYSVLVGNLKAEKLTQLKKKFTDITVSKPRVVTGLGFDVDGGRDNKDDFFSKWESMADTATTTVRDADNKLRPNTTKAQMQTIYRAIVANGEALLNWKWQKEGEIAGCTTLTQLDAVVI